MGGGPATRKPYLSDSSSAVSSVGNTRLSGGHHDRDTNSRVFTAAGRTTASGAYRLATSTPAAGARRLGGGVLAVLLAAFLLGVHARVQRVSAVGAWRRGGRPGRIRPRAPARSDLTVAGGRPVTAAGHWLHRVCGGPDHPRVWRTPPPLPRLGSAHGPARHASRGPASRVRPLRACFQAGLPAGACPQAPAAVTTASVTKPNSNPTKMPQVVITFMSALRASASSSIS